MIKIIFSLIAGILFGNILVLSIGDRLAAGILSVTGVHGIHFIRNPIFTYLFIPFSMLSAATFATAIGVKGMRKMNIALFLKEE